MSDSFRSQKVKTRGYLFKRVKNDFLSQLPADQFICLQYRPFLLPSLGDFSNLTSWYPMLKLDNIWRRWYQQSCGDIRSDAMSSQPVAEDGLARTVHKGGNSL